jgi:hypothetical protein
MVTGGGIVGTWKWAKASFQTRRRHDQLVDRGLLSLQHHEIYELCNQHLRDGFITTAALDDLDYLLESYEALGGDGTAHILHQKVQELPVRNENEPETLRGSYPDHIRARYSEREVG